MFAIGRRLVVASLVMLPAAASAQFYTTPGSPTVRVIVHAGRGWMQLSTQGQNFLVRGDSARLAAWADSVQALTARHASARFMYMDSTLGATQAMTFTHQSSDPRSGYEIVGEDGDQKGSVTVSFDSAQKILAKLRGVGAYFSPPPPASVASHAPGEPFFVYEVERQAVPRPGQTGPQYPRAAVRQRVSGEVLAQFVVDTTGRVDMSRFRILHTNDQVFSDAVRAAIPTERFFPAERDGRLVPELIQQPFAFRLH
jgi:TonB family protein